MLQETINSPVIDQADSAVEWNTPWLTVLSDAKHAGLVAPDTAESINVRAAIGILSGTALADGIIKAISDGSAARMALDAIAPAFAPGDVIELRTLCPVGGAPESLCGRLDDCAERKALEEFVRQNNGCRNLYVGLNPRRADMAGTTQSGKALDVVARRAMVLDMDYKDAPDVDADWSRTVDALGTEADPAMVLNTGNGVQVWLPIEPQADADMDANTVQMRDAMQRIGSDNMSDAPRIVRLPFTVNLPTPSKRKRGCVPVLAQPRTKNASAKPRPAADVCGAVEAVVARLGLPGKRTKGGNGSAKRAAGSENHYGATGERKTGNPAPSAEILRMALDLLPNDAGHFDDRDDWLLVGFAVKGAAVQGGIEAEGRKIWLDWSDRWLEGVPDRDLQAWDSFKAPGTGWGTLMRMLEQVNPAGHGEVRTAEARLAFEVQAKPLQAVGSASLTRAVPPREWLYGWSVVRGMVSMIVAPGGTGKSALAMVEALAMVTGRELLAGDAPRGGGKHRVWYHNAEDGGDENYRRLKAAMLKHGITDGELGDRLFMTSGRDLPFKLAQSGRQGAEIDRGVVEGIIARITELQIDALVLDPLGALHTLSENSNEEANLLMGALREIAERTGVAIILVHHTGKAAAQDMAAAGAGASRGASAFVDAARSVRQVARMSRAETAKLSIPSEEAWRYVRVDNGKANLAPAEGARWLRLVSVSLGNSTSKYPDGDYVQTVERWQPPTAAEKGKVTAAEMKDIQDALDAATADARRTSVKSRGWVGYLIADVLAKPIDPSGTGRDDRTPEQEFARREVQAIIEAGKKNGLLIVQDEKCADRHKHPCVAAGERASPEAADSADVSDD
ncbi:AAA family ATPase [Roseovarius sp. MMSF_3350]|uniref:AAA family ATPase n=1 Tax=Roseovarius sp. MMSF_3350 TaxID=3046706 RepID=UPI00273E72E7|nr:AAA family ATPase [Roseovarius sp. MMSF_3350]